jgi:hypothetical protein
VCPGADIVTKEVENMKFATLVKVVNLARLDSKDVRHKKVPTL